MTATQLRERHAALFGETTNSGNREYLLKRIAWRLQAMQEGELSERARLRARQIARDSDLRTRPPADFEVAPASTALKRVSDQIVATGDRRLPPPGTELVRVYRGAEYRVTVRKQGFEFEGAMYKSLSAVAHAITGGHWNGYYFFNLPNPENK
jgi:hypothetical protein